VFGGWNAILIVKEPERKPCVCYKTEKIVSQSLRQAEILG